MEAFEHTYVLIEHMRPIDWVMFTCVGAVVLGIFYELFG